MAGAELLINRLAIVTWFTMRIPNEHQRAHYITTGKSTHDSHRATNSPAEIRTLQMPLPFVPNLIGHPSKIDYYELAIVRLNLAGSFADVVHFALQ